MSLRQIPDDFKSMLRSYGQTDEIEALIHALENTEPVVSVHANVLKGMATLPCHKPVPMMEGRGCYLDERPLFAADPAWHQGLYYVQDASSMAIGVAVKNIVKEYFDDAPIRYLDACAAPGGKTISAIEELPEGSVVLANEFDRKRAGILIENLAKHGYASIAISNADGATLGKLGPVFDIVAVDAPCSGEGMMRKEPEAVRQWSRPLVESCAATQRRILAGAWEALRPGGVLVYSTCTFNRDENEENVAFIADELGGESIGLGLEDMPGIAGGFSTPHTCYRFLPGLVCGEGLFIAAMRKPYGNAAEPKMKAKAPARNAAAEAFARMAVDSAEEYTVVPDSTDAFSIIPTSSLAFFGHLSSSMRLIRCGLPLSRLKGKDMLPAWELAFSTVFRSDAFPALELDYPSAMAYLHGDSISDIPDGLGKGIVTTTYRGAPLGFAKNIGSRANNLYPESLRLRMDPASATQQIEIVTRT